MLEIIKDPDIIKNAEKRNSSVLRKRRNGWFLYEQEYLEWCDEHVRYRKTEEEENLSWFARLAKKVDKHVNDFRIRRNAKRRDRWLKARDADDGFISWVGMATLWPVEEIWDFLSFERERPEGEYELFDKTFDLAEIWDEYAGREWWAFALEGSKEDTSSAGAYERIQELGIDLAVESYFAGVPLEAVLGTMEH